MRSNEKADARIRGLVEQALAGVVPQDELRAECVEAVVRALEPTFGAAATRRRYMNDVKSGFKDGYLSGQKSGRFSPWHDAIWRWSATFRAMTAKREDARDEERLSRYNDV